MIALILFVILCVLAPPAGMLVGVSVVLYFSGSLLVRRIEIWRYNSYVRNKA